MTIVKRKAKKKNFSIIDNGGILDCSLSWKATGLWTWLMSKPEDWEVNLENLSSSKSDGRDSVLSALSELEESGYLVYQRWRNPTGQFESAYTVFESPEQLSEWKENAPPEEREAIAKVSKNKGRKRPSNEPQGKIHSGKTTVDNPQWLNRNGKTAAENPLQLNIDKQSTELLRTELLTPLTPQGEKEERVNSEPEEEEPAQEVIAEVSNPVQEEKSGSRENQNLGEDKFSAPARDVLSQRFDTRALHLLKEPVFLHWWANRVEKTKFGSQELEMPPMAYVKTRIRKNPESALDMWEAFQDEMGHRVDNYQLRVENGCVISPEEQEAIAVIAPYTPTPSISLPAAAQVPKLPSAPSGENAGAYRAYKPESIEVAPPPSSLSEELAKIKAKMSMPKSKPQQETVSRLERLKKDLQDPIMRPEIIRIIQNSDELNLVWDGEGNPIDVIEEAW